MIGGIHSQLLADDVGASSSTRSLGETRCLGQDACARPCKLAPPRPGADQVVDVAIAAAVDGRGRRERKACRVCSVERGE